MLRCLRHGYILHMLKHLIVLRLSDILRLDLVGFSSQVELVYCFL